MKISLKYSIPNLLLLLLVTNGMAQKKEENIGSEVVNVVKPYAATLSDAFKIKEIPKLDDAVNSKKIPIQYTIFSFPVASTFSPQKGTASNLEQVEQEQFYKNYLSIGLGSYNSANVDFFVNHQVANNQYFGVMLQHNSSQNGIDNVDLNHNFSDSKLDLAYENYQNQYTIKTNVGFENKLFNWYGLPATFGNNLSPADKQNLLNSINPTQIYNGIFTGVRMDFKDLAIKNVNVNYNYFQDDYKSKENRFVVKAALENLIFDKNIKTNVYVDHVSGFFAGPITPLEHNVTSIGFKPNYTIQKDELTINLGFEVVYNADAARKTNYFYIYPKINADYKLVGDYMIAFAGLDGGLQQNSYRNFVLLNPFVAPFLTIGPTNVLYNVSAGIKGKLASTISYSVSASFVNENNKPLFRAYSYLSAIQNENFNNGNSFGVFYDNVKTLCLQGELKARFTDHIDFSIGGILRNFSQEFDTDVWNIPKIEMQSSINAKISEKWFCGANLFYVGERKDKQIDLSIVAPQEPTTLAGFFDINCNVGYNYNKRLTGFLKANNIANQGYQRWLNFPVQQFQLVLGAAYKFDF